MNDTIIVAILSPILITIGGIISWFLKSKKESLQLTEERSRERRIEAYKEILDPLIVLITPTANQKERDSASNSIGSTKYKKAAFNLVTFGSDDTVKSYNKMLQYIYNEKNNDNVELLKMFANFILNIRKDLYKKSTRLKNSEVLEFTITDIEKYRNQLDK